MSDKKTVSKRVKSFRVLGKTLYLVYKFRKKGTLEHWVRELAYSETFKKVLDLRTMQYDKRASDVYKEYCRELGVAEPDMIDTNEIKIDSHLKYIVGVGIIAYSKLYNSSRQYNKSLEEMIEVFDTIEAWRKVCGSVKILGYEDAKVELSFRLDEEIKQAIEN